MNFSLPLDRNENLEESQFTHVCFVCLKMIVQKELTNNQFGHGDSHALPWPGLQQAGTRPLSTNFYVIQKISFKDHVCLDKSFLDGTVFAQAFFEL